MVIVDGGERRRLLRTGRGILTASFPSEAEVEVEAERCGEPVGVKDGEDDVLGDSELGTSAPDTPSLPAADAAAALGACYLRWGG